MAIFDELKSIGKTLQEAGKIEQYQQILETQEKLLEMQKRISELESENSDLREKIKLSENLSYEGEVYYVKKNDKKEGPFCAKCYDVDGKLVRLTHWNESNRRCPNCGGVYLIK